MTSSSSEYNSAGMIHRKIVVLGLASCLCGALAGCGGLGAILGQNSDAVVTVTSANANSLDLVVSALGGGENDPTACTANSNGFGCTRTINAGQLSYSFRTNELSETTPYNIYVKNLSNVAVTEKLVITLDGRTVIDKTNTIAANTTFLAAKIFRENAQN